MSVVVIGFIGRSGMGKTTFVTQLTEKLRTKGYRIAVLKDTHHQVDWDRPGKDSYRYRRAGASTVILRTPERCLIQKRTTQRTRLDRLIAWVQDADIIFVEGFKNECNYPKFEIYRSGVSTHPPLYTQIDVAGVITCSGREIAYSGPHFSIDDVDAFRTYLQENYLNQRKA